MLYRDPRWRDEPEPSGPHHDRLVLIVLAALVTIGLSAVPFILGERRTPVLPGAGDIASSAPNPGRDLDVSFGTFTAGIGGDSSAGRLPVTFTNTGDTVANARVQIRASSVDGAPITNDTALVTDLAPGHSFTQNLFTAVADINVAALQHATFSVAAISAPS